MKIGEGKKSTIKNNERKIILHYIIFNLECYPKFDLDCY